MSQAVNRPGEGRVRTVRLPSEPASVPHARRAIVEDLQARDISPQIVDEAEIVVSELVANALRHARPLPDGSVRVHWKVKDGLVEVEVTDGGGDTSPQPLPRSTWTPAGRGLRIVRSVAHEWGVVEDKGSCTVWAALGGPSRRRA
jgi:serine/threonine-protein kinase RsbW